MQKKKLKSEIKKGLYMNLLNDWGFKYVFNKEKNLIHFLNIIFQGKEKIKELAYLPSEQLGKTEEDRKAVFDVYCKNEKGEKILLEMQNLSQAHFRDRSLYYSSFLIQSQNVKGKWDYKLKRVYIVGILNFVPVGKVDENYVEWISLMNRETKESASEALNFIYVILPEFNKPLEELTDDLDYWLYILKHSRVMESQPEIINDLFFTELLEEIELKQLKGEKMKAYKTSELKYEDLYNYTSFAKEEGRKEGERKGFMEKLQISQKLLKMGLSVSDISKATGLTSQQIQQMN
jgi:predicted transposase/invertase (TIGR01784 family)